MPSKKIDFDMIREMTLALPHVEPSTIHGAPSLTVRGKLWCCPALHRSAEPDTLAIRMDRSERAKLMEANPRVYYVTDHYRTYPMVLVRLSQIDRNSLKELLGIAWKSATAPKAPRSEAAKRGSRERDAEPVPKPRRAKRPHGSF